MLLQSHAEHQLLPQEYDLELLDPNVNNHFIFSEEDLPGFKAKSKARAGAAALGMPASLLRPKNENVEKRTYDRRSRFQPYYRKAVPSTFPRKNVFFLFLGKCRKADLNSHRENKDIRQGSL
jgi:transcription initiation factor TFIIF subunit beta